MTIKNICEKPTANYSIVKDKASPKISKTRMPAFARVSRSSLFQHYTRDLVRVIKQGKKSIQIGKGKQNYIFIDDMILNTEKP